MKRHRLFRRLAFTAAAIVAIACFTASKRDDFGLGRNMELLANMFRDLNLFYVDEVDPDRLMRDAAQGMVSSLDPYTEFVPEEQMGDFELLTTGKYGGVGSTIRRKGEWVIFAQPYKGFPADKAGIRIGDRILSIEGEDARGMTTEQVSNRLKGDPGTQVRVRIGRLLTGDEQELTLTRERIALSGVPYHGFVADSIGYIEHSDFTEGCSDDLRAALADLRATGRLKGLVLDYRSNGGGILQEAVKILSLFLPKGTEVVSMKGKQASYDAVFRTEHEPVDTSLPIVVLTNSGTASAAEIVSGAMQDLDRAVLLGQRTFGKGLVQSPRALGYNAILKLTTGKYYMPSGRCIQLVDYTHRNPDGSAGTVPDSLINEFRTAAGRKVYDGGGLTPDSLTEPRYSSRFAVLLYGLGHVEDFVDDYVRRNHDRLEQMDEERFSITDEEYEQFVAFMQERQVEYESDTRRALRQLTRNARRERFGEEVIAQIEALNSRLGDDKQEGLRLYRDELKELLSNEVILRYRYAEGVTRHNLVDDKEVAAAVELLRDEDRYRRLLAPPQADPQP